MMWPKLFVTMILFGVLIALSQPATTQEKPGAIISVSVNLVKIPISVFDANGNLVSELRSDSFRIWEDQAPQEIRSFGIDSNPVSVVLLLDTSMSGKSELKKIKEAALEFAEALSREDRISIIGFDDDVYLALDWSNDLKKVRKALGKLKPGGRTALYDAMYTAANAQLKDIEGRKAIILLTDCVNNQSRYGFQEASLKIVKSQASLYVVSKTEIVKEQASRERRVVIMADILKRMFGENEDYVAEYFKKKETEISELAEKTGGRCFFPADYNRLKSVYAEVAHELKSKYYLTYISNQNLQPNSFHRVAIEYLKPANKLIYRRGYYFQPR
jgi:Ca-activated chloride channel homolog